MNSPSKDAVMHKALMKVLDEATFQLKAREVASFIQVYNWAKEMPKLFEKKKERPPVKKK